MKPLLAWSLVLLACAAAGFRIVTNPETEHPVTAGVIVAVLILAGAYLALAEHFADRKDKRYQRRVMRDMAKNLAVALAFVASSAGAQDYTIKADDELLIFPTSPPGMGSLIFVAAGEPCRLDELFAATDAMLEFFPAPEPAGAYVEAAEVQRRADAVERWRNLAAKCSRIYKAVRDGVK